MTSDRALCPACARASSAVAGHADNGFAPVTFASKLRAAASETCKKSGGSPLRTFPEMASVASGGDANTTASGCGQSFSMPKTYRTHECALRPRSPPRACGAEHVGAFAKHTTSGAVIDDRTRRIDDRTASLTRGAARTPKAEDGKPARCAGVSALGQTGDARPASRR